MFDQKSLQQSVHSGNQFRRIGFPPATSAMHNGADSPTQIEAVRTSTPPPPHIQWPIIYPKQEDQAEESIYPVSPPQQAKEPLKQHRPEGSRLLDYARAAIFPSNEASTSQFPQLPNTPLPAHKIEYEKHISLSPQDVPPMPESPSFSQQASSEAAERWRRSWRSRQRADAAPALDVPRGQAAVPSPLSQRESLLRLRAIRLSRLKK